MLFIIDRDITPGTFVYVQHRERENNKEVER